MFSYSAKGLTTLLLVSAPILLQCEGKSSCPVTIRLMQASNQMAIPKTTLGRLAGQTEPGLVDSALQRFSSNAPHKQQR